MKKSEGTNNSRRSFFKVGLGMAGAMAATRAYANVCGSTVETGEQALGPFFPRPGTPEQPVREDKNSETPIYLANDNDLTFVQGRTGVAQGQQVLVEGRVMDDQCRPVANATIIIWQASSTGRYNHNGDSANQDFADPRNGQIIRRVLDPNFQYWGKAITNANGEYVFKTIVPGFYPADLGSGWYRPPHIHFMISATGKPQFVTQMYFRSPLIADNDFIQSLNEKDNLLQNSNLSQEQRDQLVVDFQQDPTGESQALVGRFDIRLKD